jgi:hypothetical protein
MRHLFHAGLVSVIKSILREAGVPDAFVVLEARGLRAADSSRPGDVVALDFFADGRHLVIDVVMTTVYRNTVLEKVATILGYAAKQAQRTGSFLRTRLPGSQSRRCTEAPTSLSPLPLRMEADWGPMPMPFCGPWRHRHWLREGRPPSQRV